MAGIGKHKKQALKLSAVMSGGSFVIRLIGYPVNMVVAATLGPALLGSLKIFELIRAYSSYTHLGLLPALTRQMPILEAGGDSEESELVQDTVYSASMIAAGVTVIVLWGLYAVGISFHGVMTLSRLVLMTLILVVGRVENYLHSYIKGKGNFVLFTQRDLLIQTLTPFIMLAFVWLWKLDGALAAKLCLSVIGSVLYARDAKVRFPKCHIDWGRLTKLTALGLKLFFNLIADKIYVMISTTVIASMLLPEDLGQFGFALGVIAGSVSIISIFEVMLYRHMLDAKGRDWVSKGWRIFKSYLGNPAAGMVFVATVSIVALYFVSVTIVDLFMSQYLHSLECMFILSIGQVGFVASRIPATCMDAGDQLEKRLFVTVGCMVLNAVMSIAVIKIGYGIAAVAWVSTFSSILYAVILSFVVRRQVFGRLMEPVVYILKLSIATAAVFTVVFLLDNVYVLPYLHHTNSLYTTFLGCVDAGLKILISVLVCTGFYCILFYRQGLCHEGLLAIKYLFKETLSGYLLKKRQYDEAQ